MTWHQNLTEQTTQNRLKHTQEEPEPKKKQEATQMQKQRTQSRRPKKSQGKPTPRGQQEISKFLTHDTHTMTNGARGTQEPRPKASNNSNLKNSINVVDKRESNGQRGGRLKQLTIGDLFYKPDMNLGKGPAERTDKKLALEEPNPVQ